MIVENGTYYLYRHIRLDKYEPFYIGIGHKMPSAKFKSRQYKRAKVEKNIRSKFWNNIVNKTEYKVEILLESNDRNFIIKKEKEFIKLYGRKDLGLGSLVNLTDGGDGQSSNYSHSIETIKKLSDITKNNKNCIKTQIKKGQILNHKQLVKTLEVSTNITYESMKDAWYNTKIKEKYSYKNFTKMLRGTIKNKTNFIRIQNTEVTNE